MLRGCRDPSGNLHSPSQDPRVALPLSTLLLSGVPSGSSSYTVLGTEVGVPEPLDETELEMM